MTGEDIAPVQKQAEALQRMPPTGGRNKRKVNYRQYFQDSDAESSEDPVADDELGISGRDRRAAKREQQRWERAKGDASGSDDEEMGESDASDSEDSEPEPVVQQTRRRGRPPKRGAA